MFVTGMFNDISFGSYNVLSLDFWFIRKKAYVQFASLTQTHIHQNINMFYKYLLNVVIIMATSVERQRISSMVNLRVWFCYDSIKQFYEWMGGVQISCRFVCAFFSIKATEIDCDVDEDGNGLWSNVAFSSFFFFFLASFSNLHNIYSCYYFQDFLFCAYMKHIHNNKNEKRFK